MNSELFDLYKQLLKLEIDARRSVYERINHDDLCVYAHHCGRLYNNGLMIYGQAMNGWENDCDTVDGLVENILKKAEDYKVLFTVADYAGGPYKNKDGEDKIYHYKRSKFWKLNYQIITDCQSASFDKFYIPRTTEEKKDELLENAWPQNIVWSNLYKVTFRNGGNPYPEIRAVIKDICRQIMLKEIEIYKPSRILFNTGENFFSEIAIQDGNLFGLTKVSDNSNILFVGEYEYAPNQKCKIVVCKRPDAWKPNYKNTDIFNEGKEIVEAFNSI